MVKSTAITDFSTLHNPVLDIDCVSVLNSIVSRTGAKVVIVSTWRVFYSLAALRRIFKRNGFIGEIVGTTICRETEFRDPFNRSLEIAHYIYSNDVNNYVIIDDVDQGYRYFDMSFLQPKSRSGLSNNGYVDIAEKKLNESTSTIAKSRELGERIFIQEEEMVRNWSDEYLLYEPISKNLP